MALLRDRREAGKLLASSLEEYTANPNVIVLALPRGGVPVGFEIARALRVPFDVYIVRKLGVPGHEELAMGAVASDGSYVIDDETIEFANVSRSAFEATLAREVSELRRRSVAYRDERPEPVVEQKSVIIVDDGLATGASMYAAIKALRARRPREIVVAVPVAPAETVDWLAGIANRIVCPHQYTHFGAVGFYYDDFSEVSDDDVRALLIQAESERTAWSAA